MQSSRATTIPGPHTLIFLCINFFIHSFIYYVVLLFFPSFIEGTMFGPAKTRLLQASLRSSVSVLPDSGGYSKWTLLVFGWDYRTLIVQVFTRSAGAGQWPGAVFSWRPNGIHQCIDGDTVLLETPSLSLHLKVRNCLTVAIKAAGNSLVKFLVHCLFCRTTSPTGFPPSLDAPRHHC